MSDIKVGDLFYIRDRGDQHRGPFPVTRITKTTMRIDDQSFMLSPYIGSHKAHGFASGEALPYSAERRVIAERTNANVAAFNAALRLNERIRKVTPHLKGYARPTTEALEKFNKAARAFLEELDR